jgi:hypothetical protein
MEVGLPTSLAATWTSFWRFKKDGFSSFFDCHMEDGFSDSHQLSEFWSEKAHILPEKLSLLFKLL